MSPSIPTQRKVKDHIEAEINHYRRGKSHTSPSAEPDIARLQASYAISEVHEVTPGRRLAPEDKVADHLASGSRVASMSAAIDSWWSRRIVTRSTEENWDNIEN